MAVKLFNPVNIWAACNVRVEIDFNGDGREDAFLFGGYAKRVLSDEEIENLRLDPVSFKTFLFSYSDLQGIGTLIFNINGITMEFSNTINNRIAGMSNMYAPNHSLFRFLSSLWIVFHQGLKIFG